MRAMEKEARLEENARTTRLYDELWYTNPWSNGVCVWYRDILNQAGILKWRWRWTIRGIHYDVCMLLKCQETVDGL